MAERPGQPDEAMTNDMTTAPTDYRERIIVFLAFLTSEACMDACRDHVVSDVLAAALSRRWFEIYVPGDSYLDSLKGDRSEEVVQHFEACFSDEELGMLERFHGFFELRVNMAVNRMRGRAFFPDNDSWRSLVKHAAYVLTELEANPERVKVLLVGFVRQLLGKEGAARLLGDGAFRRWLGE